MPIQHLVLFDGIERNNLLPLAATRALADFRVGILTIREKWEKHLHMPADILTQKYLQPKYQYKQKDKSVFINACILPDVVLLSEIEKLPDNSVLKDQNTIIAIKTDAAVSNVDELLKIDFPNSRNVKHDIQIQFPWHIFMLNGQEIKSDIELMRLKPNGEMLSKSNRIFGMENVYVNGKISCECVVINATKGPVFLGRESEIMEGTTIRGSFALGEQSTLKMQSKIYGDTTIGPHCKVGGEVSNSVIFGYSNKAHDGFLGNSVIGEWCNLGADTNNSNLKNNYGNVKAWNYTAKDFINTSLQFCGLIMGDHSKSSINTMFNTGTVAGVGANIFGTGFPPKFIPDFSWGGAHGFEVFSLEKVNEVAQRVMERRGIELTDIDKNILKYIFEETKEFRK